MIVIDMAGIQIRIVRMVAIHHTDIAMSMTLTTGITRVL